MKFIINGGRPLSGTVRLAGAKNAATKAMVASLLTDEPCTLRNIPNIGDVHITRELCETIGSTVMMHDNVVQIHTPVINNARAVSLSRRNRIPILTIGPLLARHGEAEIPFLGGDKIGPRPVDIHLAALEAMGVVFEQREQSYYARAPHGLHGAAITLRYPSVGATENALLTAVLAAGKTTIKNAAVEPEITDLITMLQKMGASIELGANRTITIEGVAKLNGVDHAIIADRNEAVSFACLAVATSGDIRVERAHQEHLLTFLNALRRVGGSYTVEEGAIRFYRENGLRAIALETDTYPGFMTDWQQPFAVLLTQAEGVSTIHETVYEDRFAYINDLNTMGARITVSTDCLGSLVCRFADGEHQHSARIEGPTPLHGAELTVRDLRSGIAHVIAALTAKGESIISGVEEIDRGYENIDQRLQKLGANIERAS